MESLHWIPKERGLTGVKLVVCDAHVGLTKAIRRMFQGCLPGVNYVSAPAYLIVAMHLASQSSEFNVEQ